MERVNLNSDLYFQAPSALEAEVPLPEDSCFLTLEWKPCNFQETRGDRDMGLEVGSMVF